MDQNHRYKIRLPDNETFDSALRLLEENAQVLLKNPGRHTIAATEIDEKTANQLRSMNANIVEDAQYDIEY